MDQTPTQYITMSENQGNNSKKKSFLGTSRNGGRGRDVLEGIKLKLAMTMGENKQHS